MDYINGIAHNMNLDNRRWQLSQIEDPEVNETEYPQPKKAKITN